MVDPERGNYRPRRALVDPDRSDEESAVEESAVEKYSGSNDASREPNGHRVIGEPGASAETAMTQPAAALPTESAAPASFPPSQPSGVGDAGAERRPSPQSIFSDLGNDTVPPLYRDESPAPGTAGDAAAATNELADTDPRPTNTDSGRQTWVRSALTSPGQGPRARDDEATTILPRTSSGSRNTRSWQDSIDDFSDLDDDRLRLGQRTKLGLIIAGVAAVVALGLVIGWTVLNTRQQAVSPNPDPTGQPSAPASAQPTGQPAVLLNDDSMLKANDAGRINPDRTWKVALTQRGLAEDSAQPACLGGDPVEGQPAAAQTILRLLSANGKQPPGILHRAQAFTSPEEAAQAYAVAAKTLGGCSELGGYVRSGWTVTGLGDQAVGVVVAIDKGASTQNHSIVLNRTGTVMNVADVAQTGDSVQIGKVASALAAATNAQCHNAGGACSGNLSVKAAPPPVGGEEPGFLAAGDLPPVGNVASLWVGDAPDVPQAEFVGAQCENVNWAKAPAKVRTARTYLLEQGADPGFGLDEIILTMKNEKAAGDFVNQLRKTVANCPKRKLTATVQTPSAVTGIGARGTKIQGWTATVSQKVNNGSLKYRVGAVAAGPKVIYTFLSPKEKLDLTDSQWKEVAVRAGQRATQVR